MKIVSEQRDKGGEADMDFFFLTCYTTLINQFFLVSRIGGSHIIM